MRYIAKRLAAWNKNAKGFLAFLHSGWWCFLWVLVLLYTTIWSLILIGFFGFAKGLDSVSPYFVPLTAVLAVYSAIWTTYQIFKLLKDDN